MRRASGRGAPSIEVGDLSVLPDEKTAYFKGRTISLTAFEFRALEHLARHAGSVVSRADLIEHIYSEEIDLNSNVIDVLNLALAPQDGGLFGGNRAQARLSDSHR